MKLYKHNKEFLNKVSESFDDGNDRVAFITATGTGKSYVSGAYIQQELRLKSKRVLIISPRRSLNDEWKNLLKDMDKIDYVTYQRFYRYTPDDMDFIVDKYSLVLFDEIHHLGAKVWGKAALKLFDKAKEATHRIKFLGLSADPTRYDLDIDIADEMFDSKIIGYTIGEAIEAGILPKFEYRVVTYKLQENIERLKKELKGRKRLRAEDPVHLLIDKLDKESITYSVEKIVKSGLSKIKHNKLIVFVDHINKIGEEIHNFENMFPGSSIYQVHSKQSISANQIQIREFGDSDSELSFLFSVDMLNEGIHLDGINGIIMLRRTESPTLYMQQLGRVMSSNKKVNPVVFDFVSNYSLIGRFELPKPEMTEPLTKRNNYNKSNFDVFQTIIDSETLSIIELCQRLEELRFDKWTDEEKQFLIDNYNKIGRAGCAEILNKTEKACTNMAYKLGISTKSWTDKEIKILKDNYKELGLGVMELLPNRSRKAIQTMVCKLDLHCRLWSEDEIKILKDNYSPSNISKLEELLPNRNRKTITVKAVRMGLTRPSLWSEDEIKILKDNYESLGAAGVQELLPNKSRKSIIDKAGTIGIKEKKYWVEEELKILKDNYPKMGSKVSSLIPNKNAKSCISKARRIGIKYKGE